MYTSEYDLIIAEGKSREFQNEMMAIRLAQQLRAESDKGPGLLGKIVSFASHSLHIGSQNHKVRAAA
jgi:hypothetical protein